MLVTPRKMAEETITVYIEGASEIGESIILDETAASQLLCDDTTEIVVEMDESCVNSDGKHVYRVKSIVQNEEKKDMCLDGRHCIESSGDLPVISCESENIPIQDIREPYSEIFDSEYANSLKRPEQSSLLKTDSKKNDIVNSCESERDVELNMDCNSELDLGLQASNCTLKDEVLQINKENATHNNNSTFIKDQVLDLITESSNDHTQFFKESDKINPQVYLCNQEESSQMFCKQEDEKDIIKNVTKFTGLSNEERKKVEEFINGRDIKRRISDPNLPFTCLHCDKAFKKELSLRIHELSHNVSGAVLALEMKKKTVLSSYACPICKSHIQSRKALDKHMQDEHSLFQYFTCHKCRFVAVLPQDYTNHMHSVRHNECQSAMKLESKKQPRPFLCSQCGFSTINFHRLQRHMLVHKDVKDFGCPHCPYLGKSSLYLKKHMEIHEKEKKYLCTLCAYATRDPYSLKRHTRQIHTVKNKFKCRECDAAFSEVSKLRIHAMLEHNITDTFFCLHCSFTCKNRLVLKQHTQIHKGLNVYTCDQCSYTCNANSTLHRHKQAHSDLRPHECSVCGRVFRQPNSLKRHMKRHSNEKPFSCSLCDYKCKFQNTLTLHMKVHSDVKAYNCDFCDYSTKYPCNLRKHLYIHDEVKHFPCHFCEYKARLKESLKRHLRRVHKISDT